MKVTLKGTGTEISLTQREFIAKGGEGSIYGKGNMAYKIYEDPSKMIPSAKIKELSILSNPFIVKPEVILLDKKDKPIGYTMRLLKDTYALCQLFTKSFKQRNGLNQDIIVKLIKKLQCLVSYVHSQKILVVDLNEMNFLADNKLKEIYAIDVNSYQTSSFPATAIMRSVQDFHCHGKFTELSDWYSFGIIAFQMLIGIHPYKGKHSDYENIPKEERLEERMRKNASVFSKKASMPKVCEPLDIIPPALKSWLIAVLEDGKRVIPPVDYEAVATIIIAKVKEITGGDLFVIERLEQFDEEIIRVCSTDFMSVVITENTSQTTMGFAHLHIKNKVYPLASRDVKLAFTSKLDKPVAFWMDYQGVKAEDVLSQARLQPSPGDGLMECNGRVYVKNGTHVYEQILVEFGNNIRILPQEVGRVLDLPGATQLFDGVILQNMIGVHFASIFPGIRECRQVKLRELKNHKIIEAKYENHVLIVIGVKKGQYDRFVFRFDDQHKHYDVRITDDITYTGLNFTVAAQGVCVLMTDEEKIEVFSNKKDTSSVKVMDDDVVEADMRLFHKGSKILFARRKSLYKIAMK